MSTFHEIYVRCDPTSDLFNVLSPTERIFVFLMFRAILPFNRIYREQNHRYTNAIIDLFEYVYEHKENIDDPGLLKEIETYIVYLWTNHGFYFLRDSSGMKRTPNKLGMKYLNQDNLEILLQKLNYSKIREYKHLFSVIFDDNIDSDYVVPGNIEKSGNNFYGRNFSQKDYESLAPEVKNRINAYFEMSESPVVTFYSTQGKCSNELKVTVHWLREALKHVKENMNYFDEPTVKSLEYLIDFFETGDETKFKLHSIEWLKIKKPRIQYTLGFIEQYHDPMGIRGNAGGEVTYKIVDLEQLNPVLLNIEQRMPIPKEYMRTPNNKTIMNVSINKILFSGGDFGPMVLTAAYCLPNSEEIRSEHGSKQVIYKLSKSLDQLLNPELSKVFRTTAHKQFMEQYDKEDIINDDLWDVQVILHETLGHASGKLHRHTFKEGDNLTIQGKTHNIGDTIEVNDDNLSEFIGSDMSSLEELRAEINALYMSISEINVLSEQSLFKNWHKILPEQELKKKCIQEMATHLFRRLVVQKENFEDISGAHARANTVITNYLLDHDGIAINEEIISVDGEDFHLLEIEVINLNKAIDTVIKLVQLIQAIKSTGDGMKCKELFEKYTKYPVNIVQARLFREYQLQIRKKLIGNIKGTARLYPNFVPVIEDSKLVDIKLGETMDIFEQNRLYKKLMTSTKID